MTQRTRRRTNGLQPRARPCCAATAAVALTKQAVLGVGRLLIGHPVLLLPQLALARLVLLALVQLPLVPEHGFVSIALALALALFLGPAASLATTPAGLPRSLPTVITATRAGEGCAEFLVVIVIPVCGRDQCPGRAMPPQAAASGAGLLVAYDS